ncbi:MAG TPA: TIGR03435 family protein [Acidobacteriaceae bacterium]|nr:TIGR03435 family protein [Acidobacteriaceae bacterium]
MVRRRECGSGFFLLLALGLVAVIAAPVCAQSGEVPPGTDDNGVRGEMPALKFDIISFKRCPEGARRGPNKPIQSSSGDSFGYHCRPIQTLIYYAYTTFEHPFIMTGDPDWVENDLYEFTAKVAPEDIAAFHKLPLATRRMMIRGILADELHLKVHLDPAPHAVYDLVLGKGDLKLTPFKVGETNTLPDGRKMEGQGLMMADDDGTIHYQGEAMNQFAEAISVRVDRQVIDKTGLPGRYDFTTTLPLAHYNPNTDAADSPVPKTFDAVKALGLNLVSARELTGGIILDHIDRPPEN